MDNSDLAKLSDIRGQMMDLLAEAKNILRRDAPKELYTRARHTWISHIDVGLGGGEYVDRGDHTFRNALCELGVCAECMEVPCTCVDEGPENPNCSTCEETPCLCDEEDLGDSNEEDTNT